MKEPSIAGIKFFVASSSIEATPPTHSSPGKYQGTVILTGHFNREDLWTSIVQRLNGAEMHRGGDLQSELITILQGQVEQLEEQLQSQGTADRERAQRSEQASSIAVADAVRARQHAQLLQAQLEMKERELQDALKANQSWVDWHAAHQRTCHTPY